MLSAFVMSVTVGSPLGEARRWLRPSARATSPVVVPPLSAIDMPGWTSRSAAWATASFASDSRGTL